ncbi:MAG: caspase family protein [Pseudonocardiaceae bacterium]
MDPRELFLNHYAFLVGIDEYDHFPNLRGAHSDATTLRETLRWIGYPDRNLWLVPAARTSLADLNDQIDAFLESTRRSRGSGHNPDIVVFWAGHGVPGDDGGFLIARNTRNDSLDWRGCALSLERLAEKFKRPDPATLTMFFDVCHSVRSRRDDRRRSPRELILARMRDAVLGDAVRTTFVGVSTFAHEISVWDDAHGGMGRTAGILTDVLQRAVRGERRDDKDHEPSHSNDCIITDEDVLYKLEDVVRRKAGTAGLCQQLSVLTYYEGPSRKVGFAVRRFADTKLEELELPVEADCIARIAVGKDDTRLGHLTNFGREMVDLVARLTRQEVTKNSFLQKELELACQKILELRTDPHLGYYVYLLLHCRQEAKRDDGAKNVLEECYNYLISGGCPEDLGRSLHGPYRAFAIRHALPWSCGIPVLDNGRTRYAPIIYHGAPLIGDDAQRTFVTTAALQREAVLDVWRADASNPTISGWPLDNRCHRVSGRFSRVMPKGKRVWVRIGLDVQGCVEKCKEDHPDVSVPMKIMLGRDGNSDCDWRGHWHLDLEARWPRLRGVSDSEPSGLAGLRSLMNECVRSLETLLAGEGAREEAWEDEVAVLVKWLYRADVMMRMLDESRLEHIVLELIAAWQDQPERSVLRLSRALRRAIGVEPDTEENSANNRSDLGEAALEKYEQWLAEQPPELSDPDAVRRAELQAWLLRAVMRRESAATRVVALVTTAAGALRVGLDRVLMAGASPAPERAMHLVAELAKTADYLLRDESTNLPPAQLATLRRWAQLADQAREGGRSENLLNDFLDQMRESIGLGAWLLATNFTLLFDKSRNLSEGTRNEFDALVTTVRLRGDQRETREAAEGVYQWLRRLRCDQTNEGILEECSGILLVFTSLLWPASRRTALAILSTDASWTAALTAIAEFADPGQTSLMDTFRAKADDTRILWIAMLDSLVDSLSRELPDLEQVEQPEPIENSISQAHPRIHYYADEYYEQAFLAVPPGEQLGT